MVAPPLAMIGVATMTWSAIMHRDGRVVRLDLVGDLRQTAAEPLCSALVTMLEAEPLDELLVGLDAVVALDVAGVTALMAGYVAAVDCGTVYRVRGAHGPVRRVLHDTGTLDVLADSDDLAALLLAVLKLPEPDNPRPGP
jgi:anti-anti-sigma regulatory factor